MFKRDFFICLLLIVGITSNAVAQTTYIHTNAQGSVIAKSDTSGNITARYHYQPFGKRLENSDFSGTGFTGHQRDNDLGLTYMQARYYDETLGRFYSNDPVGYTAKNPVMSFNRYIYVNNGPYKYIDPDGNYLLGINVGMSVTFFKTTYSASLSIAADHNGKAQLTFTPESGLSNQNVSGSAFARVMVGLENTTVDTLDGLGASASLSKGPASMSVSAPAEFFDAPSFVNGGAVKLFNGFDLKNSIVEGGIGTPAIGTEVTGTTGYGFGIETTILGDIGNAIGSELYDVIN